MTDDSSIYHSSFRQRQPPSPSSSLLLPSDLLLQVDNVDDNDNDDWELSSATIMFPNSTEFTTTLTTHPNYYYLRRSLQSRGYSRTPSNDGVRLSFLIPLILMILCIISGACRNPGGNGNNSRVAPNQPLEDEDEKKKKQEKAQELRRQRLIKSFEVNNVLMVRRRTSFVFWG